MSIKKLFASYLIACLAIGVFLSPFILGYGSPLLVLVYLVLSFLGPFSFFVVGQHIPISIALVCFVIGIIGIVLAIYGFKSNKQNIMHIGNGLWAFSGSLTIVVGMWASCC